MKILFVEDDYLTAQSYKDRAEYLGWTCDVARNVAFAKATLTTRAYDVVVLDHELPDGKGSDVLRFGRAYQPKSTRFVSASSLGTSEAEYPDVPWVRKTDVWRYLRCLELGQPWEG